ncbi:MAG: thermonuclease family protein [Nitrospirales bacterium]|nr:thermonuclease family protein [Nitrospirales bacterium]
MYFKTAKLKQPSLLVIFALIGWTGLADAETFQAKVVHIADGDTITVLNEAKRQIRIRLNGIDCPERGQAFGRKATEFTKDLVALQTVTIQTFGQDRYGRTIGDVILHDGGNLNRELVGEGWCWWYRKYAPGDTVLEKLETEARHAKKGLWNDPHPIPPWDFRHRNISSRPQDQEPARSFSTPPASVESAGIRGNRRSKKYHRVACPSYDAISPKNRVQFETALEAEMAGFTLAGNCP